MAKDSFFIRASITTGHDGSFDQAELDLGAYTNLGSSKPELLRIHNIHMCMTDDAGEVPTLGANTATSACWQITTQSQTGLVLITDDSVVAAGQGGFRNADGSTNPPNQVYSETLLPQDWSNGYLVAVPTLFLGGFAGANFQENVTFSFVMECTTESATKASAVSLAISQQ